MYACPVIVVVGEKYNSLRMPEYLLNFHIGVRKSTFLWKVWIGKDLDMNLIYSFILHCNDICHLKNTAYQYRIKNEVPLLLRFV